MFKEALTSDELASEGYCVEDAEAGLGSHSEAVLLLVKADVADLLLVASPCLSHAAFLSLSLALSNFFCACPRLNL